jgi:hypothetical protein
MGQYIYEGHMGGLYCTDDSQDWEDLYCEQCGDSDWEMGYAETMEDAWKLLKGNTSTFDDRKCDICPHHEDYAYCDNECEEYIHSGGYSLAYVMEFLFKNFECEHLHEIYLVSRHDEEEGWVLVNCSPRMSKFGEAHELPMQVCPFEEYVDMLAYSMTSILDGPSRDLKEIASFEEKNKTIHIYECYEKMDEEYPNENWREAASYRDNSWYGYMRKEEIKLVESQKGLEKYL